MTYTKEELAVIILDFFDGLEYKHKREILSLYSNVGELFTNIEPAVEYVRKNISEGASLTVKSCLSNGEYLHFILKKLESRNIKAITYLSKDYPEIFANLPSNPLVLYAKGRVELLNASKKLAIVGSRKTLPFVLKAGESIANELSSAGVVIVSGSAVGGDRCALLGAKDSGNVISLLASGHDYVSPQSNRDLVDKIAQKGLVISEYPPETQSAPWRFPMRNRLISALSDAVLILSGAEDSGTRYTAKFAEAYSKRIYAIPYSLGERSGGICNMLIKVGKAQLVENAEDVAGAEGIELNNLELPDLDEDEMLILSAMDGSISIDDLALKTGKKSYEILSILSMLEIKGLVAKGNKNSYTALIKLN